MNKTALNASLILLAATLSPAASAQQPMEPSAGVQAVMSSDLKDFFETAASSNRFEIESSKLALKRATEPALKDYAKKMVADHEKAGRDLQKLAEQKGVALPDQLLRRHQMMLEGLREEDDGNDFDDEYRDKMITSHKEAVSLFDEAAKKSPDKDVKAFAAKMLPKLQEHGGQAKALPDK